LPVGRDEISPILLQNFPKIFSKAKISSKNHPNLHLMAFNKLYWPFAADVKNLNYRSSFLRL
jgi:hypothetical protein